ncbi:MAG: FG-GAP-like repeat-containing protein [Microthrixaceae bacterium]
MPTRTVRSILIVLASILALCTTIVPGLTSPAAADDSLVGSFVNLTNRSRADAGLPSLQFDPGLSAIANTWNDVMIRDSQLKHNPSLSSQVSSQVTSSWTRLGENVGVGYSPESLQEAFMGSTGHRSNILGSFNRVGIGSSRDGSGRLWVTVVFMQGPAMAMVAAPSANPDGPDGPAAPPPKQRRTFELTGAFLPVSGDFNGDGYGDVVWYSASGDDKVWWGAADGGFQAGTIGVGGQFTPVVGDFDGDGRDDIYWFSPGGGDSIYYGTASGFRATYPNANGDFDALPGDFNGDGRDDIYWFSPGGGDALYLGGPTGFSATYPNANGAFQPHVGDFDGNDRDDILWYSPGPAGDALWQSMPGGGFSSSAVSIRGTYSIIEGTFDDTPGDDVLLYDPSSNPDALWFR